MWYFILFGVLTAVVASPYGGFSDEKYENFNVKELIESPRLLKSYVMCYLEKGKCTPEGNDIKKWIPEALHSKCGKCTEKQKPVVAIVIKAIMEKLPSDWEELSKKYNPKGEYTELNQFIQEYALNK